MNSCATLSLKSVKGEQSPATPYLAIVFTRLGYEPSYYPKSNKPAKFISARVACTTPSSTP